MIITIVRLQGTGPFTLREARTRFGENAASYLKVPGLIQKTFLLSEDGDDTGAVYWWRDRESAEAKFNPGWLEGVTKKYGTPPVVEYFDAPIMVDVTNQVLRVDPPDEPETKADP